MIDFRKFGKPRPAPKPSGHQRYTEPVVAPLQAAGRLNALEGWMEYVGPPAAMPSHIWGQQ